MTERYQGLKGPKGHEPQSVPKVDSKTKLARLGFEPRSEAPEAPILDH